MPDPNQPKNREPSPDELARTADTGIPDDPESTQSIDPFVMQTQRGQGKEDGDPSQESDQPLDE